MTDLEIYASIVEELGFGFENEDTESRIDSYIIYDNQQTYFGQDITLDFYYDENGVVTKIDTEYNIDMDDPSEKLESIFKTNSPTKELKDKFTQKKIELRDKYIDNLLK